MIATKRFSFEFPEPFMMAKPKVLETAPKALTTLGKIMIEALARIAESLVNNPTMTSGKEISAAI